MTQFYSLNLILEREELFDLGRNGPYFKSVPLKIVVTTKCPICEQEFTREAYVGIPIGVLGLTVCPDCCNGENIMIVGNTKPWGSGL